jgi:hypothetical protein
MQVLPGNWSAPDKSGSDKAQTRRASVAIALKQFAIDPKTKQPAAVKLPAMPPKPPDAGAFSEGRGPIHVESTPSGAEVWMFIGMTNQVELSGIQAGVGYELRVLKDGFLPGFISIAVDDWRDGGDRNTPINAAKKKSVIERNVDLVADPNAKPDPKKVDPKKRP